MNVFLNIDPKNAIVIQSNIGMKCIQFHWEKFQKPKTTCCEKRFIFYVQMFGAREKHPLFPKPLQ